MKLIPLTRGLFAQVDDEDYERVNQFKWYAQKSGNTFYAVRNLPRVNGKQVTQRMHRLILCVNPEKPMVDHRDGSGCNNQKSNLRPCNSQENQMNQKIGENYSSKHKGVSLHKPTNKWRARIGIGRKRIHLGLFIREEDAAHAYDMACIKHFGSFAHPNFPPI